MKVGFFPLDRELRLGEHSWSPETIKQAVRLGVEIPSLRRAAEGFQELTKIPMSKSSLGRLVKEYGGKVVVEQEAGALLQHLMQQGVKRVLMEVMVLLMSGLGVLAAVAAAAAVVAAVVAVVMVVMVEVAVSVGMVVVEPVVRSRLLHRR